MSTSKRRAPLFALQMRFPEAIIDEIDALRAIEHPDPAKRPSRHAWILDAVTAKLETKRTKLLPSTPSMTDDGR